jgi:hypothetical protein
MEVMAVTEVMAGTGLSKSKTAAKLGKRPGAYTAS